MKIVEEQSILSVGTSAEPDADYLYSSVLKIFMRLFLKSINPAHWSAAIAEEITTRCLVQLSSMICRD